MTALKIRDRLARIVGDGAEFDDADGSRLTIAPTTESACATILKTASNQGWKVRLAGNGQRLPPEVPADLVLTTRRLHTISDVKPADLFATAEAGVKTDELHRRFAESGMWLAVDPPGENRTIGSVAATGASGSLQTGFGPVRDQILGLTVITPAGRTIVGGGRVVKNVAGYDIPKLVIGSFGAFGLITKVHLRLRVAPDSDATWTARGTFEDVLSAKQQVENSTVTTAALELRCVKSDEWTIAVRLVGTADGIQRAGRTLSEVPGVSWTRLDRAAAEEHWSNGRTTCAREPVTLRLGSNPATIQWTVTELQKELGVVLTMVYGTRNTVRWSGQANAEPIRRLRSAAANHSVPLTIEAGPWLLLASEGHFGELRSGVAQLVSGLRSAFDPEGTLVVPLASPQPGRVT